MSPRVCCQVACYVATLAAMITSLGRAQSTAPIQIDPNGFSLWQRPSLFSSAGHWMRLLWRAAVNCDARPDGRFRGRAEHGDEETKPTVRRVRAV